MASLLCPVMARRTSPETLAAARRVIMVWRPLARPGRFQLSPIRVALLYQRRRLFFREAVFLSQRRLLPQNVQPILHLIRRFLKAGITLADSLYSRWCT